MRQMALKVVRACPRWTCQMAFSISYWTCAFMRITSIKFTLGFDGAARLFWGLLANPSINLLGYIRNRKIYDRGFACSQNPSGQRGFGLSNPPRKSILYVPFDCFWKIRQYSCLIGIRKGLAVGYSFLSLWQWFCILMIIAFSAPNRGFIRRLFING